MQDFSLLLIHPPDMCLGKYEPIICLLCLILSPDAAVNFVIRV